MTPRKKAKDIKVEASHSSWLEVSMTSDSYTEELFNDIETAEDVVPKLKNLQFADERKRKSGIASKTITYLDKDSNARMTIKVSDAKNINDAIEIERVRNLKVITVGTPATVSQDVLRFLTGK